jgi:hypothetical protein
MIILQGIDIQYRVKNIWTQRYLKSKRIGAGEHRAHRPRLIIGLAPNVGFWARGALCCRARRAGLGIGTLDDGATRARASRAFANLTRLGAGRNAGRTLGHRRFQNILGHVGKRRALRLQHILAHIGHRRARRHRRL